MSKDEKSRAFNIWRHKWDEFINSFSLRYFAIYWSIFSISCRYLFVFQYFDHDVPFMQVTHSNFATG